MPAERAIITCGVLTVSIGSLNAVANKKTLPSSRFLIGTGVAFFLLSALAEAEPEVAQALSIAVLTTVLLGQGDGALSWINHRGEIDTAKSGSKTGLPKPSPVSTDLAHGARTRAASLYPASPSTPIPNL